MTDEGYQFLVDIATNETIREMDRRVAIEALSEMGGGETSALLQEIYTKTRIASVKSACIAGIARLSIREKGKD